MSDDSAAGVSSGQSPGNGQSPEKPDPAPLPALPGIVLTPSPLHRGPFAAVYRGWDWVHRCDVIVKVQRATGDAVAAERFRREAAVMKRLRHPNIVALYQFHDNDPAALVLEYVPGRTLAEQVTGDGWLTPVGTAGVIEEIAAALDCAHAQGVIHRDVKPSNILLPRRGSARLYDFGVAHIDDDAPLTVMGDILGTIEYASPEQVHGNEAPDARSDVYSLAAVAYFALTGTPPFRAADASTQAQLSVMHRQVFAEPPPLRFHREDLSPEVEAAVLRGLAKAPASRYPSAGQFAAALRAAVEAGAGAPERPAMAAASRRTGALAGALAGATLLLGGLVLWRTEHPAALRPIQIAQGMSPSPLPPKATLPAPTAPKPRVALAPATKPAIKRVRPSVAAAWPHPLSVKAASRPELRHSKPAHFRPAGNLVAAAVPPAWPKATAKTTPKRAWLYVYARQAAAQTGPAGRMAGISAQSVWVDGHRAFDLAGGRWTSLPAGRHLVSFIPDPKSGYAPHKDVAVMLTPGAHLRKQILLPAAINPGTLVAALAPRPVGWYTVSGWVPVSTPGQKSPLARASAQWVKVDGQPVPALALGRWAPLPAGKHVVTFQPTPALGIGPKTWNIDLTAHAHLDQKIPLATPVSAAQQAAPPVGQLSISGWLPVPVPGRKPRLVPVAAEWIKVDGLTSPELAQGRWVSLPAGRHVLTFQPVPGSGAAPATCVISLSPQARLKQLVPLPAVSLPTAPLHLRNP